MTKSRHFLMQRRALTIWLLTLTLLMKLMVPTGYMFGSADGAFSVELCPSYAPQKPMMMMAGGKHHSDKSDHGKAETPCAFSGLTAPSLAGADALLLAAAVDFIVRTVFRESVDTEPGRPRPHLRPPLRGPPQTA